MTYVFKSVQQILADQLFVMRSQLSAADILKGSVLYTIAQASSLEDAQQYVAMSEIIDSNNLDNVSGEDLVKRAKEFGLTEGKLPAGQATGLVTIGDSAFTKVSSKIFSGLPGPIAGSLTINIENSEGFTTTGSVIIGRGTDNVETVAYTSITDNITYFTLNLSSGLLFDHGTDENVILSQGGIRTINSGEFVEVPETDTSPAIRYEITETRQLLDGEDEITGVSIEAQVEGTSSNIPANAISQFVSNPFSTATVKNPEAITNGRNEETDQELRDRIRNHIQSLSKGTIQTVKTSIIGITNTEQNKRVVSATFIDPTDTTDTGTLYIDDGSGFEPTFTGNAIDSVLNLATGNEQFLQLSQFPLVKASLETVSSELYDISNGDTLVIEISGVQETITFGAGDFTTDGAARAQEVAEAINLRSTLIEARTTNGRSKVVIEARARVNEAIKVVGGTANSALNFVQDKESQTLRLYKNDKLLTKDGRTAFVETTNLATYGLSNGQTLTVIVDGKSANVQTVTFNSADFTLISSATAQEVANAINKELSGAVATSVSSNQKVRITSNTKKSSSSKIQVTGGTANGVLGFPTTEASGKDNDYILNRLNGQIELQEALVADDVIAAGTTNTRAFIDSTSSEPYVINSGEVLEVEVDGGLTVSHTFASNGSFTAQEIVDQAKPSLSGMDIFVIQKQTDNFLRLRTNTWDDSKGSLKVTTNTTANSLTFPEDVLVLNEESNVAFTETQNIEDFDIGRDQNLIVSVDSAVENKFNIIMQASGSVTTANSTTVFRDSNLGNNFTTDDFFNDFLLQFDNDTTTASLSDLIRTVTDYDATNGEITVSPAFPIAPVVGDSFKLLPVKAKNVTDLLNNKSITSLSTIADVLTSDEAKRVQISTKTAGSEGKIQVNGGLANGFSIPFTNDGTVSGTFTVASTSGISIGLDVKIEDDDTAATNAIITSIVSASPNPGFIIEVDNGVTDLTNYTVAKNARVASVNGLNFLTTSASTGIDGYKYYTGLLQQIQQTIDGRDNDSANFPGIKAAGVQIEVKSPVLKAISIVIDVTTRNNVSISTISPNVKSVISTYINTLKVGEDVIIARIIDVVMDIESVINAKVTSPSDDIAIKDNEKATIRDSDIIVG